MTHIRYESRDNLRSETARIIERYDRRRERQAAARWSALDDYALFVRQERERALVKLMQRHLAGRDLASLRCLEIGCGTGNNLAQLVQFGFDPRNLTGNELLDYQSEAAKLRLPQSMTIDCGDALDLPIAFGSQDIVYQSTVFSSILDERFQIELAQRMWSWVKVGGGVLWYDFTVSNPYNPDVRGVPARKLGRLFPDAEAHVYKVTLAPPIGRQISRFGHGAYALFNAVPFARTHVLCWLAKKMDRESA